jgi:LmbE family N-acetylglucosaminyl deacetylase
MSAEIQGGARDGQVESRESSIYLFLFLRKIDQIDMFSMLNKFGPRLVSVRWAAILVISLAVLSASFAVGQTPEKTAVNPYYEPLPQEKGVAGLKLMLRRLQTTARLMQVDAHPDDEDGGMLTLESRGKGATVTLLTLTRGEGGQNKTGSNLFDELGVLRTLEVLAADRYYGIEQRFSRVADFGYSKNPQETFQKWQGHDIALADIVRVIRQFQPDVLVARFSGTERDGHGHHQASAILTQEAFRAAADPNRFPDQIQEGLLPWQAKKLYIGNVCSFGAQSCPETDYTIKLNTGEVDPLLGMSYVQFAVEGLKHQESQGLGEISIPSGPRYTFYRLVDSVLPPTIDKDGHEKDFFDGIDTSIPGLATGLGAAEKKVPWLRPTLVAIQEKIDEAVATAAKNVSSAGPALGEANGLAIRAYNQILGSQLSEKEKKYFAVRLFQWLPPELQQARALAEGASLDVVVDAAVGSDPEHAFMAVPGRTFDVTAILSATSAPRTATNISLKLPEGWESKLLSTNTEGNTIKTRFTVHVPVTAKLTRPYWHRDDPETEALNTIDDPAYQTLPFPPPPVEAIGFIGQQEPTMISAGCMVRYKNASGAISERPLAVAPAFSVLLDPGEQVIRTEDGPQSTVQVDAFSNLDSKSLRATHGEGGPEQNGGTLQITAPEGWGVEPAEKQLEFHERGKRQSADFAVHPGSRTEGRKQIRASLKSGHLDYREGYSVVTRDDLGTFYYYQPALQRVSIVDVKVAKDLKLAYVMGAGDDIPTVLRDIGIDVTLIPPEKLDSEDLSRYQTIVLGIRAYDTQKELMANNKRLLDFVQTGGRLVVQYNAAAGDFNAGKFTPYPATLSRARVSVEEAPVTMLDPANPIFHSPNEITPKDFDGWVQERGLYFMSEWDSHYTPLLESHDPGEGEQKGGLLVAHYGKGTYIYTGYAFFRQLPAGVPGAVRLFVNLVAGR